MHESYYYYCCSKSLRSRAHGELARVWMIVTVVVSIDLAHREVSLVTKDQPRLQRGVQRSERPLQLRNTLTKESKIRKQNEEKRTIGWPAALARNASSLLIHRPPPGMHCSAKLATLLRAKHSFP